MEGSAPSLIQASETVATMDKIGEEIGRATRDFQLQCQALQETIDNAKLHLQSVESNLDKELARLSSAVEADERKLDDVKEHKKKVGALVGDLFSNLEKKLL